MNIASWLDKEGCHAPKVLPSSAQRLCPKSAPRWHGALFHDNFRRIRKSFSGSIEQYDESCCYWSLRSGIIGVMFVTSRAPCWSFMWDEDEKVQDLIIWGRDETWEFAKCASVYTIWWLSKVCHVVWSDMDTEISMSLLRSLRGNIECSWISTNRKIVARRVQISFIEHKLKGHLRHPQIYRHGSARAAVTTAGLGQNLRSFPTHNLFDKKAL